MVSDGARARLRSERITFGEPGGQRCAWDQDQFGLPVLGTPGLQVGSHGLHGFAQYLGGGPGRTPAQTADLVDAQLWATARFGIVHDEYKQSADAKSAKSNLGSRERPPRGYPHQAVLTLRGTMRPVFWLSVWPPSSWYSASVLTFQVSKLAQAQDIPRGQERGHHRVVLVIVLVHAVAPGQLEVGQRSRASRG